MRLTHLINPFRSKAGAEHDIAQRVTFAALRKAVADASDHGIDVEVVAAAYADDQTVIEPPARLLPPLTRSILDIRAFADPHKFPLVSDVLGAGWRFGTGEHLIFTNMDISPQPHFYRVIGRMIIDGRGSGSAFAVNRRTISRDYNTSDHLVQMYTQKGLPHEGHDCFIFPRAWVPRIRLGTLCVGAPWFDWALIANLEILSDFRMCVYLHQRLTFHLGNDRAWLSLTEYDHHNRAQLEGILAELLEKHGPVPPTSQFDRFWRKVNGLPPRSRTFSVQMSRKLRLLKEMKYLLFSRRIARPAIARSQRHPTASDASA